MGYKIAPNRFKTTYRYVLTFEEKKQSIILTCLKLFQGFDQVVMRLFWRKGQKIRSNERFKTSAHFERKIPRELF